MAYQLIITEKPSAAKKIADALADGKVEKKSQDKVPYYKLKRGGKDIMVACAVGHLYNLEQNDKNGWTYPVFDIKWVPSYENKGSEFTRKYLSMIRKLAKDADTLIVATDYDIEGEVIGLNIVRFACGAKDAKRMKYSTLTKDELIQSYENAAKSLDWGQARAGETRHKLDWIYGINLSRALTLSIKNSTGRYKIMSAGRVQGPALKTVVDREKEIQKFKPKPFWEIELQYKKSRKKLSAMHKKDKFWDEKEADSSVRNAKGHDAIVSSISTSEKKHPPPTPFDLTTLQTESHRCFGIPPKRTLEIAQELYTGGYISYPRTSSQKLPPSIGYRKILSALAKSKDFSQLVSMLLEKGSLKPNEGKASDPAHPAIFPTGILPNGLASQQSKIYDMVVKRFIATFGDWATRETLTIELDANKEIFITKGSKTKEKGWYTLYEPYVKLEETELPAFEKGESLTVVDVIKHSKETQPPKRYTEASIIKELEKRGLGTKATRAAIVDSLVQRKYITEKPVAATELGIKTCDVLHKYSPKILEEEMTREFEEEMEKIRGEKTSGDRVLKKAENVLTEVLEHVKEKEKAIGKELKSANEEMERKLNTLGKCPKCGEGELVIKRGKYGRFVACNRYPDCKATVKIPQTGVVSPTEKECEKCGFPIIRIGKPGKRQRELCVNPDCPTKKIADKEVRHEAAEIKAGQVEKECPKCGSKLVIRTSVYGKFLGCSSFPKCKHMEPLKDGPLKEDFDKGKKVYKNADKVPVEEKKEKK